jgi:hypothetical protein
MVPLVGVIQISTRNYEPEIVKDKRRFEALVVELDIAQRNVLKTSNRDRNNATVRVRICQLTIPVQQHPARQIDPEMPLSMNVAVVLNPTPEFKRQEATHSEPHLPRASLKQGLKVLTNIGCCSFHCVSAKHGQAHLNYCTEGVVHSGDFSMQSIALMHRKVAGKQALDLANRCSKLAVLILVGQLATSYFVAAAL